MVKHIVFWKVKYSVDKPKNIDRMIELLTSLVGKIEGLVSVEMGSNFNSGSEFDVALFATFKNNDALTYYQDHPEHVKCKEFIHTIVEKRACVDYTYDEKAYAALPLEAVADVPTGPVIDVTASATPITEEATAAPMRFDDAPPPAPMRFDDTPTVRTRIMDSSPAKAPASTPNSTVTEKTTIFGKKKLEVEVTPLDQRSDTWTCPNCGKIMPNYVGTCGCGEIKPFEYEPPVPTDDTAEAPVFKNKPADKPKAATPAKQPEAPKAPASTPNSTVTEKTTIFGKKKLEVEITPLDQRSDTWTCPNCGKIMPNYVGTCGCGEIKPFEYEPPVPTDDTAEAPVFKNKPADKPKAATPAKQPEAPKAPASTPNSTVTEKTTIFGKKKLEVEVTPLDQRSDTWTCPNCGKIMPNYVGTCGCGEIKPFEYEPPVPSDTATADKPKAATPVKQPESSKTPASTPNSTVTEKTTIFGKKKLEVEVTPLDQRSDTWTCPNCGKIMPNYVGTCGCGEIKPFEYEPPVPSDTATADKPKAATPAKQPEASKAPASTPNSTVTEKTTIFGKKKLEVEVTPLDQRSDTWTCPNCGKIMPNYVGTCGCGEIKPFEYEPPVPTDDTAEAPVFKNKPADKPKAATPAKQPEAPKAPASTPNSTVTEKTTIFGKKKLEVEVTPLDQRSDTWTCPNCGKIMPNYVGTCGCGEIKPFEYEPPVPTDDTAEAPVFKNKPADKSKAATPAKQPEAPKAPASTPNSTVTEKTTIFGKKKLEVEVTPLDQRSDTWTCPNCGKIMPNYVGTCGCGEIKPFEYEPPVPTDDTSKAPVFKNKPADKPKAATPAKQPEAPKAPASTPNSTVTEKTTIFGKKKLEVEVTPLDQRSDTWTCPNCGKIMPNYVGTCGCGEIKPFEYEPPVPEGETLEAPAPQTPVAAAAPEPLPPNTWKCPSCGKIQPNYIGTCGCGEVKPFELDLPEEPSDPGFAVSAQDEPQSRMTPEMISTLDHVQPSLSGYNPQVAAEPAPAAPDFSFIHPQGEPKSYHTEAPAPMRFDDAPPAAPMRFDDAPPAAPMRFDDAPPAAPMRFDDAPPTAASMQFEKTPVSFGEESVPAPMRFDDAPPAAPMRFDDAPPAAPMRFDDAPPAAPMRFDDAPPAAPMRFDDAPPTVSKPASAPKPAPTASSAVKDEKKHRFGKKAKEQAALRQAQDFVNNRKDVPNDGTWTCPNCGKVMPKYVGTCGCGESQPFEF